MCKIRRQFKKGNRIDRGKVAAKVYISICSVDVVVQRCIVYYTVKALPLKCTFQYAVMTLFYSVVQCNAQ